MNFKAKSLRQSDIKVKVVLSLIYASTGEPARPEWPARSLIVLRAAFARYALSIRGDCVSPGAGCRVNNPVAMAPQDVLRQV
jgi:hypothetical protein